MRLPTHALCCCLLSLGAAACAPETAPTPAPIAEKPATADPAGTPESLAQGYYEVRRDLRRCARPRCGGYFLRSSNLAETLCGDGQRSERCYVAEVDWASGGPDGELEVRFAASPERFVVRGTLEPLDGAGTGAGSFWSLRVSQAFEDSEAGDSEARDSGPREEPEASRVEPQTPVGTGSADEGRAAGTLFRVRPTEVVCIAFPCLSFEASELNAGTAPEAIADVDLSGLGSGATRVREVWESSGAPLLRATRIEVTGPAGTAPGLRVLRAYLPAPAQGQVGPGGVQRSCGSRGLAPCEAGNFCAYPRGANCGRADAPGTCTPRPEMCTQIFAPVCGCDGQRYSNECVANAAGVSVDPEGSCDLR